MIAIWLVLGCSGPVSDCGPCDTALVATPPVATELGGTRAHPPRSQMVGVLGVDLYDTVDGDPWAGLTFQQPNFYRNTWYQEAKEVAVVGRGVDSCEVWLDGSINQRVESFPNGPVSLTLGGQPLARVEDPGVTGEYSSVNLEDLVPEPWGRAFGFSGPGGELPAFAYEPAVIFPAGPIGLTRPLPGGQEQISREDLHFEWDGLGSDPLWLYLGFWGEAETNVEIFCTLADDGSFHVPPDVLGYIDSWPVDVTAELRRTFTRHHEVAPDQWVTTGAAVKTLVTFDLL